MKTRLGFAVLAVALMGLSRVYGQTPVVDAANLAMAIKIAGRVYDEYRQVVQQRLELARMRERLAGIEKYKTTPIPGTVHDIGRYGEARALLTALNSGDARGDLFR